MNRLKKIYCTVFIILLGITVNMYSQSSPFDQPYASYWFIDNLLVWEPQNDPDALFNKGAVELQDRFVNTALMVNSNARANEGKIANLSIFAATSGNPSQGSLDSNYYAFNYWQYCDLMVLWGGSAGEGIILAPNPGIIDASHRNGVKVLGTIFFPPEVYGGQFQWIEQFIAKDGDKFPVADKLIEVAEYYGFDGWFINQETNGGNSTHSKLMRDFMRYYQGNSDLELMWYDAMVESGPVSWKNALTSDNDMFFQYKDTLVSEHMFLNFWWYSSSRLADSRTLAQSLGRSEFDLYAGIDVQANGYNTNADWDRLFPDGQPHVTSLGFYVPSWTYHSSNSIHNFYERANRFWVGENRDPGNTTTTNDWKGLANYVPAKSVINDVPFVTNFCTGQGYHYYINGEKRSSDKWKKGWNNIALQDILPSWRWVIESSGDKLYPEMDWTDAYYGGNCLKVSGNLAADNHIKLFSTKLPVSSSSKFEIAYKSGKVGTTNMQVGLSFTDNPTSFTFLDVQSTISDGWNTQTIDLSSYNNDTIAAISLKFLAGGGSNYAMKIGRIGVIEGTVDVPAAPTNVSIVNKLEDIVDTASVRLTWTHSTDDIYYYNIYQQNPDQSLTYLGGTPNNAYFVSYMVRQAGEETAIIEVEAVSKEFGHSTRATVNFTWDGSKPPSEAENPSPADEGVNISRNILLKWAKDKLAKSYKVYIGKNSELGDTDLLREEEDTETLSKTLDEDTKYYWRVDAINENGVAKGAVWSFTTGKGIGAVEDKTNLPLNVITARGEINANESKYKAFDASYGTVWQDLASETWIQMKFGRDSMYAVSEYVLASGKTAPEKDPKNWKLLASNDNTVWDTIDTRTNEYFIYRSGQRRFTFVNGTPYKYHRFEFENNIGSAFQIAEIDLYDLSGLSSEAPVNINNHTQEKISLQVYPNPFNFETNISFNLHDESSINIDVYDITGQHVQKIFSGYKERGAHIINWNANDSGGAKVPEGVYFIKIKTDKANFIEKVVLIGAIN